MAVAIDPSGERRDECPSPLGWQDVLAAFQTEARTWRISHGATVLRVRTVGEGRPLYFLNGFAGTSELFCLLVWLLRDEFRCVLFDEATMRSSAGPRPRRTPQELAADLFAVADSQGDATFSLFSTSFGSVAALTALATRPPRIDRAVLQGGFAFRRLSAFERLLCSVGRFVPGTLRQIPFRETMQRASHRRCFPPFDFSRWAFFAENTGHTLIRDVAGRGAVVGGFDFRRRLGEIQQPVLLIHSEYEGQVSAGCHAELERGLPNARTEPLHSSGHLSYLTHPHRLAKCVRSFVCENPAVRAIPTVANTTVPAVCGN